MEEFELVECAKFDMEMKPAKRFIYEQLCDQNVHDIIYGLQRLNFFVNPKQIFPFGERIVRV